MNLGLNNTDMLSHYLLIFLSDFKTWSTYSFRVQVRESNSMKFKQPTVAEMEDYGPLVQVFLLLAHFVS